MLSNFQIVICKISLPNIQDDVALLGAAAGQDVPPRDHERRPQLNVELLHDFPVEDVA